MVNRKQREIIVRILILCVGLLIWTNIPGFLENLALLFSLEYSHYGVASLVLAIINLIIGADIFTVINNRGSNSKQTEGAKPKKMSISTPKKFEIRSILEFSVIPQGLFENSDEEEEQLNNSGIDKVHPMILQNDIKIKSIINKDHKPSQYFAPVPKQAEATEEEKLAEEAIDKVVEENFDETTKKLAFDLLGVSFDSESIDQAETMDGVEVQPKTKENIRQIGIEDLEAEEEREAIENEGGLLEPTTETQ